MNVEHNIVKIDATIRDALSIINLSAIKMCVVVDENGRLVRTIVDGDIRRSLLEGANMETPISLMVGQSPKTGNYRATETELLNAFNELDVGTLVLVDEKGYPVSLVNREALYSKIFLSPPHIGQAEINYVHKAFEDNWIAPTGPNLDAFENALSNISMRAEALALSSATAALHLALRVLGVDRGKRVYVSDLTFAASLQPILYQGATPILIDSEPTSWNMSPSALSRKLSKDAKAGCLPAAIIVVHLYGQSADMNAIVAIANNYDIPVVEDAAESLGAYYDGSPSGSHGVMAAYSFNGNKIITTSGGGALVSDRSDLMAKARKLSTQGRDTAEHYQHSEIAYNYRMSNVLAGIGLGQLELLNKRVKRRRDIFDRYRKELGDIVGLSFQNEVSGSIGNRWLTVISMDPNYIDRHPYQLMKMMRVHGIETRPAWKPMHMQPLCDGAELQSHSDNEVISSRIFLQSLCLPSGSNLTDEMQNHIINVIRNFCMGRD